MTLSPLSPTAALTQIDIRPDKRVSNAPQTREYSSQALWGKDGITFDDLLDLINPLQHIPVVGSLYRELTGDTLAPAARLLGGTLLGGPLGFAGAIANEVFNEATGKDIGENVAAAFRDDAPAPVTVAAQTQHETATPPAPTPETLAALAPALGPADALPPTLLANADTTPSAAPSPAQVTARYETLAYRMADAPPDYTLLEGEWRLVR